MAAPSQSAVVSYSATPGFLSSPTWTQIQQAFRAQFPLRNIHWKSTSRVSLVTIQELDIKLVALDSIREESVSQIPVNLLEKPLLNVYFVLCDDNDLETYRTTVRKHAKDWHATISARKNQEWLIIQVVKQDTKIQTGAFFQLKGTVLDKLRAEFNADKRERCVQLSWSSAQDSPMVWGEIVNKLKDGLLSAFEGALSQREEDVRRSESQRLMPGWNFCTFFILKESLASSFQSMHLLTEALMQYDELENTFADVLSNKNLSWFGSLITPAPRDDSAPLLSLSRKSYRDLILANTISIFDLRIYLLARQCQLLANMNQLPDACRRSASFLGAFGRRLREVQDSLWPFFVEGWIYSSALSVVDQCSEWEEGRKFDKTQLAVVNAGKGELLELARTQLDIIGVQSAHLPAKPPFSHALSLPAPIIETSGSELGNKDLARALSDKELFYDLYIGITNRAIDMYAQAGRRKFALKLHGSLAALDVHRSQFDTALTTYTSLPAHYAPHKWDALGGLMLSLALDTHQTLEKPKDGEWLHVLLSFLSAFSTHGPDLLLTKEDSAAYLHGLITAMRVSANDLKQDLIQSDHSAMSVRVHEQARLQADRDGILLDVTILNRLPCAIPIDEVGVVLAGAENVRLNFVAPFETLLPGKNTVTLACPASSPGTYLVDSSEVIMGKVVFRWSYRKDTGKVGRVTQKPHLVRIPKDHHALNVQIRQPKVVVLDQPSSLQVVINSGRNEVNSLILSLSSPTAVFRMAETSAVEPDVELTATKEEIMLNNIPKDKQLTLIVNHADVASSTMRVMVNVRYVTKMEPTITRQVMINQALLVTLPISVNVEDFFRGTRLFSRFTVSTTSHQHVRVASTSLECGHPGLKVVKCNSNGRDILSVTPAQPAHFLFFIDSDTPVRESLTLHVHYRMLRDEVQSLIEEAVHSVAEPATQGIIVELIVRALESDASWIEQYGLTNEILLPEAALQGVGHIEQLQKVKDILAQPGKDVRASGSWREMQIPVDVPSMNIVASVHLEFPSKDTVSSCYAGQAVPVKLGIRTSFNWDASAESDPSERQYQMQYDVEEMVRDWLVSGRKKGDFIAKDGETYTVELTLIPLHHGELLLPKVAVWALPVGGPLTMGSLSIPSTEAYQKHGAERIMVLPRGGRTTFVTVVG
ncbi:hypothetical protein CYLTODRAFT_494376 [Cylindrobasidium torrendii FP15055 ss-10]|uniref:Trafficking protein particle complex subunit 10 n=1 Tax=Cylindrobasidium torrendii FP15055 ss-10 TaxID=1314674 RepID=A0A0D7AWS8_9AGAR|nr:hypothetical protein CYLTODRAFT_494376 [Cylindrobasidium torrendii FP15055 ss-10]